MSYLEVELLLLAPMVAGLVHLAAQQTPRSRRLLRGIAVLAAVATVWTTPWDNWMVATGVWTYPPEAVLGTIGWIPVEEQAFFVVQTLLTGSLYGLMSPPRVSGVRRPAIRVAGTCAAIALFVGGLLLWQADAAYLGSFLTWFMVPLGVQLAWGADRLAAQWKAVAVAVAVPTIVLVMIDAVAVYHGTWSFADDALVGLHIGPLPVEEVVFFTLTNVLVVCGLALWDDLPNTGPQWMRRHA